MKLFLFIASVLYLLGLKLTSKIDIIPHFFQKSVSIESTTIPETKQEANHTEKKPELIKKDTVISTETKGGQLIVPSVRNSEK